MQFWSLARPLTIWTKLSSTASTSHVCGRDRSKIIHAKITLLSYDVDYYSMRYSLASMVGMATTFCIYFLFHFSNKSILSLPCLSSPLTMYNKTIIGFRFSDMQNYQCLSKSYLPRLRLG